MAYIKQNWAEMQANEIPVEAKHMEHIEEGLAEVINKVGKVITEENTTWQDLEFCITADGYYSSYIDKLPLEENKNYKIIITDTANTESAYELPLMDAGALVPDFAGYKVLYIGDFHTGGNLGFLISQDSCFDMQNGTLIETPGLTGILLVGYQKAVLKEIIPIVSTQHSIQEQDEAYAIASQTDFDCIDEKSPTFLKNKPFGETIETYDSMDFDIILPESVDIPYIELDTQIDLDLNNTYTLEIYIPNSATPVETVGLLCGTVRDLVSIMSPDSLSSVPEELLDLKGLVTADDDYQIVLCCGFNPVTLEATSKNYYRTFPDLAVETPGCKYVIKGIQGQKTVYKKIPSKYTESPDFEETNKDLGSYIKNMPFGVEYKNKDLCNIPELEISSSGYGTATLDFMPVLGREYIININNTEYKAIYSSIVTYGIKVGVFSAAFGTISVFDKEFLIEMGVDKEAAEADHGKINISLSNSPGTTVKWPFSITGPAASYTKLPTHYTASVNVLPASKNSLRVDKLNGDYYISNLKDSNQANAIGVDTSLNDISLTSKTLTNFCKNISDPPENKIINITDVPLEKEDTLNVGSLLIASETLNANVEYFDECGPIITSFADFYLYAIPSIAKIFKLDKTGISTFADLSKFEATWQEFISKLNTSNTGYIKMAYTVSNNTYGASSSKPRKIFIVASNLGCRLVINCSSGNPTENMDTDDISCYIDNAYSVEATSSSSRPTTHVNINTTGCIRLGDIISSGLLYNSSGKMYSALDTNGISILDSSTSSFSNLCTVTSNSSSYSTEGYYYRYLDANGVEHWHKASSFATGISNIVHTNYAFRYTALASLPGFSDSNGSSLSDYFVTYTAEHELIVRNSDGYIVASKKVTAAAGSSLLYLGLNSYQFHLIMSDNCYYIIPDNNENYGLYRIDVVNNELVMSSYFTSNYSNKIGGYLTAPPKILGNYLILPTSIGCEEFNNIHYNFFKYIPLYKTPDQLISQVKTKLFTDLATLKEDTKSVSQKTMTLAIDGLSTDTEIPSAKAVFEFIYPDRTDDWQQVQKNVKAGLGPVYYPVGYEFTTYDSINQQNITWVVAGHDHHQAADPSLVHTMTLESKYIISDISGAGIPIQFNNNTDLIYYARDGLKAGAYCIRDSKESSSTKKASYISFTLNTDVPAGGCIRALDSQYYYLPGYSWSSYNTLTDENTLETFSITRTYRELPTDAEFLGDLSTNDRDVNSLINVNLIQMGSLNYAQSNIHQWLNSDKEANAWWIAKTITSRPPKEQTKNLAGFMRGLPEDFLQAVQPASIACHFIPGDTYESIDGVPFDTSNNPYKLEAKFFLPAFNEISTRNFPEASDGTILELHKDLLDTYQAKFDLLSNRQEYLTRTPMYLDLSAKDTQYGIRLPSISQNSPNAPECIVPLCIIA